MSPMNLPTLNQFVDISEEFLKRENLYFNAARVDSFDPSTGAGCLQWNRYALEYTIAFDQGRLDFVREDKSGEFLETEYPRDPVLPFRLSFVTPRTIRLRMSARNNFRPTEPSLMLASLPAEDSSWIQSHSERGYTYRSPFGLVSLCCDPFRLEFRDAAGRLLTQTQNMADTFCLTNIRPTPLSFVQCPEDLRRHIAASFSLAPDEKLYGTGESFTRLNKRGQKISLWAMDGLGVQTSQMYKPVPFYLSSRGYGVFVHTSAPLTFDFGNSYDQANVIYQGDDELDLFIFLGEPKDVLSEYTALTGRSPLPPLWSFGLWMSQMDCDSSEAVHDLAARLRKEQVPCDVLHLDTKWFDSEWHCNFQFSPSRFPDPQKMISDLNEEGFRISLWQIPYFAPPNPFFAEIVQNGYAVQRIDGGLPTEDAILDMSNPETVRWYQNKLAGLLELGVSVIKVDFGEAAPRYGWYASGKSGFFEHNLYPLRYNQAAAEITLQKTGQSIIWARSAWAGSQRYPVHWGGDAENTDSGMAATLRGGLSLGLCGFSFWSHDIGGFAQATPRNLYRRWLPFGMLTSHSRCHGSPPKVPWAYDEDFVDDFRRAVGLKYRLMPYVYTQAALSAQYGLPLLRPLFLEYPGDATSWFIEDEYLFGSDLLVAPFMEETDSRMVYLPPGQWIDYQTKISYQGARWHQISAGEIPIVLLVHSGAAIPQIELAQSTQQMNWKQITWKVFGAGERFKGVVCFPGDNLIRRVGLDRKNGKWDITCIPDIDGTDWQVNEDLI